MTQGSRVAQCKILPEGLQSDHAQEQNRLLVLINVYNSTLLTILHNLNQYFSFKII